MVGARTKSAKEAEKREWDKKQGEKKRRQTIKNGKEGGGETREEVGRGRGEGGI